MFKIVVSAGASLFSFFGRLAYTADWMVK